jgi:hypothetical protein
MAGGALCCGVAFSQQVPYTGVVGKGNEIKKEPVMEVTKVKALYELRREKLEACQRQALQKAWEYKDDPLYHRGWAIRYFKYVEEEKALALELYAELEAV